MSSDDPSKIFHWAGRIATRKRHSWSFNELCLCVLAETGWPFLTPTATAPSIIDDHTIRKGNQKQPSNYCTQFVAIGNKEVQQLQKPKRRLSFLVTFNSLRLKLQIPKQE